MAANKAKWVYSGAGELGGYIQCSACQHKISTIDFEFADKEISACPWCGRQMNFDELDLEQIMEDASRYGSTK